MEANVRDESQADGWRVEWSDGSQFPIENRYGG